MGLASKTENQLRRLACFSQKHKSTKKAVSEEYPQHVPTKKKIDTECPIQ